MNDESCLVFSTALGWSCAAWRRGLLRELTFGHRTAHAARLAMKYVSTPPMEPPRSLRAFVKRMQSFAVRPRDDFSDLELDLSEHTEFQRLVVAACREIPIGETLTYGELARLVGRPGAARAVGTVMSTNRFPLIVPCHRVVASGGSLGGYSAPEGLDMKRRLLAREQEAIQFAPSLY